MARLANGEKLNIENVANISAGGAKGRYVLSAIKGGNVVRSKKFDNLITNTGLDSLTKNQGVLSFCRVGTGTTPPSPTQTSLASDYGVSSPIGVYTYSNLGSPSYIARTSVVYTFAVGAISGTITEVGVFRNNSGADMFSRALIADSGGNPVSFPVFPDEQLQVTYILDLVPNLSDTVLTQNIGASTYSVVCRPSQVSTWPGLRSNAILVSVGATTGHRLYSGPIGSITGGPSGSFYTRTSITADSYSDGSFARIFRMTFGPSSFSGDAISASVAMAGMSYQWQYSSPITKTSDQTLVIPFTISWSRL